MQRIQTFRMFESRGTLTEEQEAWLNKCTRGSRSQWSLNPAGEVDVKGDFDCWDQGLKDFKGVKFGRVSGDFYCSENELTSLAGAPREVGRDFDCQDNKLTSLVGAPQEVGVDFSCYGNRLTSLKGAPREVGGNFYCAANGLTSLVGAPQEVGGDFWCHEFEIPEGQWGLKGWLDAYVTVNAQARRLLLTLIGPDAINQMMQEAPEQTLIDLATVWNDPDFAEIRAQIRIPDRYREEMGLLGDLGELGF